MKAITLPQLRVLRFIADELERTSMARLRTIATIQAIGRMASGSKLSVPRQIAAKPSCSTSSASSRRPSTR